MWMNSCANNLSAKLKSFQLLRFSRLQQSNIDSVNFFPFPKPDFPSMISLLIFPLHIEAQWEKFKIQFTTQLCLASKYFRKRFEKKFAFLWKRSTQGMSKVWQQKDEKSFFCVTEVTEREYNEVHWFFHPLERTMNKVLTKRDACKNVESCWNV